VRRVTALLLCLSGSVAAEESAPGTYIAVGLGYMRAATTDTQITTFVTPSAGTLAFGIPESFESRGIDLSPHAITTPVIVLGHFVSDHVVVLAEVGIPPLVPIQGSGVAALPGPSGALFQLDLSDPAINPLGMQRLWSPVVGAQYRFGPVHRRFRPFLGAGATYTWFTRERVNPAFARALDERFGQPLAVSAAKPGPTSADVNVEPLWAWVVSCGGRYALDNQWGLTGSIAYAPLDVHSVLTLRAADGSTLARSRSHLEIEGAATAVSIDYRFGG